MPATGRIVQVTGPVVDIEFPPDQLPAIFNAVVISMEGSVVSSASNRIICEVQQHLGNDWVRAVSMTSTDGIKRGMSAVDTGAPIQVRRNGHLERFDFNEKWEELHREGMLRDLQQRIRDVRQGPAGDLYLLTAENDGALLKIEPGK